MSYSNYPTGAANDKDAPYNQPEPTQTPEDILQDLICLLEELTEPDAEDFTCSTCTAVYEVTQEARKQLIKLYY